MFTSMRKGRREQWTSSRGNKNYFQPRDEGWGRARIVNSPHAHFVCCLGLGLETSLQVCARPPGLYRKSYSGPKIFDRSVCLYVPVSKVHHRNTIAPFFMMMCVRRTETSKDSEKLVTTYAPPLFGADDQYWNIGTSAVSSVGFVCS